MYGSYTVWFKTKLLKWQDKAGIKQGWKYTKECRVANAICSHYMSFKITKIRNKIIQDSFIYTRHILHMENQSY